MSSPFDHHPFLRMNGIGNAIIVLDLRGDGLQMTPHHARAIARADGLAYDQMMVLYPPRTPGTEAFVHIYNNDGTLSGACGNGTRCVAWALMQNSDARILKVETQAGILDCTRLDDWHFTVDMGPPKLGWQDIPLSMAPPDTMQVSLPGFPNLPPAAMVNMGNPHAVFFMANIDDWNLPELGPKLENHPIFPQKANISFAQVLARGLVRLRVWERGVGITLACGSAACATLVAGVSRQLLDNAATIRLPGGELQMLWRNLAGSGKPADRHVEMSGAVELEFAGRFDPAIFASVAA
ncbi:MAG: diaminopimelate epimerase [Hyphomicrobiales bacterium]|nr:diaminopimelate epimerase [Hyphomicrobiales bacterium]MDE2114372.1 diaminopimelate epimerase [Hyphomicrobiales bacterium]